MKAYMYILQCADESYYCGSTIDLIRRVRDQHQCGLGANYTRKRLPVKLVYYEEFLQIDEALRREKQIKKWSHAKKKALIERRYDDLRALSRSKSDP